MTILSEDIRVIDTFLRTVPNKSLIVTMPDPILILSTITEYIIYRTKMIPIAYVDVKSIQPMMYSESGIAVHPFALYFSPETPLIVLKSPYRLSKEFIAKTYPEVVRALVEWSDRNEFERILFLDVMPSQDESKIFFITEVGEAKRLHEMGFKPYDGFFTTRAAYFLDECMKSRVTGILLVVTSCILGKALQQFRLIEAGKRDPSIIQDFINIASTFDKKAAINILKAVSKITGYEIPLDKFEERVNKVQKVMRSFAESTLREFEEKAKMTFGPI